MGTHPIFESDFDCLTENKKMSRLICGSFNKIHVVSRTMVLSSRVLSAAPQLDDAPRVASDKVLGLVDEIANLTLQEVADLNTELKKTVKYFRCSIRGCPNGSSSGTSCRASRRSCTRSRTRSRRSKSTNRVLSNDDWL